MNIDSGGPPQQRPAPDIWRLPEVLDLRVRNRHFDPPRRVTSAGVDREVRDGIEVEIRLSEPFVIRALSPVLWIGDEPLTSAESNGKDAYRFFSFTPEALKADAPISLGWSTPSASRKRTRFRYAPPK
jgi:hypothetical protein